MALKNAKGNYLKVAVLESINVIQKKAYVRIYQYDTEQDRIDNFPSPEKNFCIQEVSIPDEMNDFFTKSAYELVKNHSVKTGENKVEPVTEWVDPVLDDEGIAIEPGYDEVLEEGYSEDIFETPYGNMEDC